MCNDTQLIPLPDFENYQYRYVSEPPECKLVYAWINCRETERRLVIYRWAESLNDPTRPLFRTFLNDCVSAFLLTFETTLQIVKDYNENKFDDWISGLGNNDYDVTVKGLRMLRNLIAHVVTKPVLSAMIAIPPSPMRRKWIFPSLSKQEWDMVRSKKLEEKEIQTWNDLVNKLTIAEVFENGLARLNRILAAAETSL